MAHEHGLSCIQDVGGKIAYRCGNGNGNGNGKSNGRGRLPSIPGLPPMPAVTLADKVEAAARPSGRLLVAAIPGMHHDIMMKREIAPMLKRHGKVVTVKMSMKRSDAPAVWSSTKPGDILLLPHIGGNYPAGLRVLADEIARKPKDVAIIAFAWWRPESSISSRGGHWNRPDDRAAIETMRDVLGEPFLWPPIDWPSSMLP